MPNSEDTIPSTYTARERDEESGLFFYRARYYDPSIGRFLTPDPIGFEGGDVNLYAYVSSNPIRWTDPDGLSKSEGIPGNDQYYRDFRNARGNRKKIEEIGKRAAEEFKKGKISKKRMENIKKWKKLAKDGRLWPGGIPVGVSTFDIWCTKNPGECYELLKDLEECRD